MNVSDVTRYEIGLWEGEGRRVSQLSFNARAALTIDRAAPESLLKQHVV